MLLALESNIKKAVASLKKGAVIAYPTESVFGLGCDPFNPDAVGLLLSLKRRPIKKGLILIASDWSQLSPLVQPVSPGVFASVRLTWPGPITWVFPASDLAPMWIRGDHTTIAVRVTDHPIASTLCTHFGGPIVSTSANIDGFTPMKDERSVAMTFPNQIDTIVSGALGGRTRPSEIRHVLTGDVIRQG